MGSKTFGQNLKNTDLVCADSCVAVNHHPLGEEGGQRGEVFLCSAQLCQHHPMGTWKVHSFQASSSPEKAQIKMAQGAAEIYTQHGYKHIRHGDLGRNASQRMRGASLRCHFYTQYAARARSRSTDFWRSMHDRCLQTVTCPLCYAFGVPCATSLDCLQTFSESRLNANALKHYTTSRMCLSTYKCGKGRRRQIGGGFQPTPRCLPPSRAFVLQLLQRHTWHHKTGDTAGRLALLCLT